MLRASAARVDMGAGRPGSVLAVLGVLGVCATRGPGLAAEGKTGGEAEWAEPWDGAVFRPPSALGAVGVARSPGAPRPRREARQILDSRGLSPPRFPKSTAACSTLTPWRLEIRSRWARYGSRLHPAAKPPCGPRLLQTPRALCSWPTVLPAEQSSPGHWVGGPPRPLRPRPSPGPTSLLPRVSDSEPQAAGGRAELNKASRFHPLLIPKEPVRAVGYGAP